MIKVRPAWMCCANLIKRSMRDERKKVQVVTKIYDNAMMWRPAVKFTETCSITKSIDRKYAKSDFSLLIIHVTQTSQFRE